jgi:hypothetical protein
MGLDLKLLPIRHHEPPFAPTWYAFNILQLERDYELFSQFTEIGRGYPPPHIPTEPLPAGLRVWTYQDEGAEEQDTDAYDERLTFTRGLHLRALRLPEDATPWNRAVVAFLREVPEAVPVVLWWC